MLRLYVLMAILAWICSTQCAGAGSIPAYDYLDNQGEERAEQALEYVDDIRNKPCDAGGTHQTLPVQFNYSKWTNLAMSAVRTANYFTKLWLSNNGTPPFIDDRFMFAMSRTNIEADPGAFGCMVAFGTYHYKNYRQFCSYAYKKGSVINVHDISVNYNFLDDKDTEWWYFLSKMTYNLSSWLIHLRPRYNATGNTHGPMEIYREPYCVLEDGHWTKPYFDCGGGNIWMVTYSAPVFGNGPTAGTYEMIGIVGIDIDLTYIDINQCDRNDKESVAQSLDIFRGTHRCLPSTKCVPMPDAGFRRGMYTCTCRDGYYFGDAYLESKEFRGVDIEEAYSDWRHRNSSNYFSDFNCVACQEGCFTCVDDSPCLAHRDSAAHAALLAIVIATAVMVIAYVRIIRKYKAVKVIKVSSPMFLYIMCIGSLLLTFKAIVEYLYPSRAVCVATICLDYIGFFSLYGAMLLKNWRIVKVFSVTSAAKVKIPDKALVKMMIPILVPVSIYLAIWIIAGPGTDGTVVEVTTSLGLRYKRCAVNWWDHAAVIGRSIFLLWGVQLSYVIRKAPSSFNESKYISAAIYNCISSGTFVIIIRLFLASQAGPTMIYLMSVLELQIQVTITLNIILVPKFYLALTGKGNELRIHDETNPQQDTRTKESSSSKETALPAWAVVSPRESADPLPKSDSKDAIRHLTPDEVSIVLAEMRRAGVCSHCQEKLLPAIRDPQNYVHPHQETEPSKTESSETSRKSSFASQSSPGSQKQLHLPLVDRAAA